MKQLWIWYVEKCRLSQLLLGVGIVWCATAWLLLRELAPLAYVGLHAVTSGLFFALALRAENQTVHNPPESE
jgi:hypothetical protein